MKPLSITHVDLVNQWHPTKNRITPNEVTAGSSHNKVWWLCPNGHEWQSTVYNRTRKNGSNCPYCSNRQLYYEGSNSLEAIYPNLAKLWHPTKNGSLTPNLVVAGGERKYHWKCPKGEDHEWESSIHGILSSTKRYKGTGCPVCRGIKVVKSNNLATLFPNISKEWIECISHPGKTTGTVTKSSNVIVLWQCQIDNRHSWKASLGDRTNAGLGCPYCSGKLNKSEPELIILFELKAIFPDIDPNNVSIPRLNNDFNTKQVWHVDIIVPFKTKPLIIEYDGEYAHKMKFRDNDVIKTKELIASGYNVIRLREASLPKINSDWDINFPKISRNIIKRRLDLKQITNEILKRIKEKYQIDLTPEQNIRIEKYFSQSDLINIDSKEAFVFNTLKEKITQRELRKKSPKTIMPFDKARDFSRSLKLKSISQWRLYARKKFKDKPLKPNSIPSYPERVYKNLGWISFQDWLGIEIHEWRDFSAAKVWIKKLKLKGETDWRLYLKGQYLDKPPLPEDIPRTPYKVYKNKWHGIRDWLGIKN